MILGLPTDGGSPNLCMTDGERDAARPGTFVGNVNTGSSSKRDEEFGEPELFEDLDESGGRDTALT